MIAVNIFSLPTLNKLVSISIFFNNVYYSCAIAIGLFRVVSRLSEQLPLTAKIFYLLALRNPVCNCYVYILAMVTILLYILIILLLVKMVG